MRQRLPTELREETRALTWDEIKDKYRIVCFGDSITFGEDLPCEQAYPAVVADLLRQGYADKGVTYEGDAREKGTHEGYAQRKGTHQGCPYDVVVVNAGICGHTSVQGLARLERDVLWYKPHVVLISFGLNDGKLGYWPLDPLRERQMHGERNLGGRVDAWLSHSHLWLTLRARTRRLLRTLGWHVQPAEIRIEGEPQPRVSHQGFGLAQERIVDHIRKNGGTALLLTTTTPVTEAFNAELGPAQHQRQLSIYDEYNRIIRDVASKRGVHLVDLHAIFTNHARAELASLLAEDGVHLTSAGERLVALSVLQALEESGLPGNEAYPWR